MFPSSYLSFHLSIAILFYVYHETLSARTRAALALQRVVLERGHLPYLHSPFMFSVQKEIKKYCTWVLGFTVKSTEQPRSEIDKTTTPESLRKSPNINSLRQTVIFKGQHRSLKRSTTVCSLALDVSKQTWFF